MLDGLTARLHLTFGSLLIAGFIVDRFV